MERNITNHKHRVGIDMSVTSVPFLGSTVTMFFRFMYRIYDI